MQSGIFCNSTQIVLPRSYQLTGTQLLAPSLRFAFTNTPSVPNLDFALSAGLLKLCAMNIQYADLHMQGNKFIYISLNMHDNRIGR